MTVIEFLHYAQDDMGKASYYGSKGNGVFLFGHIHYYQFQLSFYSLSKGRTRGRRNF
jgi:hypothetical protein